MARTGLRKLVDVYGSLADAMPVHVAIDSFLLHASIPYERHHGMDHYDGTEYYRYFVKGRDLERAREVLPLVREWQEKESAA